MSATALRTPAPTGPRTIGRYSVEAYIGQGGMGRVWLARDTVLGRKVAIKVLRDDLALPPTVREELIVRMGHEARAAAAVSHPNIVTLHDMGEDPEVGLFLVFEYVTTRSDTVGIRADERDSVVSLRDRLKSGPLPSSEVAKLARELGSALTFAHEAGVIHRDVKPENILFSRTGFKIADFGIARIPDSTITRANMVLGTPAYTAPEALSTGDFGPASDQFSLAATIYEAATGARAFAGDDAIATAGRVSGEAPPPLQESLGTEGFVRALDTAVMQGLAKTAEARFATCAELGLAVSRAIEGGASRRPSPGRAGPHPMLTPISTMIEFERPPLSSRMASVERAINEHAASTSGTGETPRPSIFVRRQTHRFQNIVTAISLLVIGGLVVLGRRTPPAPPSTDKAIASAIASAVTTPSSTVAKGPPRPRPILPSQRPATAGSAPSSAPAPTSAPANDVDAGSDDAHDE